MLPLIRSLSLAALSQNKRTAKLDLAVLSRGATNLVRFQILSAAKFEINVGADES